MIKRNLVANYIGQGWSAIMSIAFIPLYIRYLGIESYGLIGLFGMLLTWLGLLDLGMTPTLSREMARFTGGAHTADSIRTLLRTIEIITIAVAFIICIGVWLLSDWMANSWLKADKIHPKIVAEAFSIMGIVTALRFIENIYRSTILGLQKHVIYNFVSVVISTLRGLGAVFVLVWISNSIRIYFIWQGIISILTLIVFASITYYYLPKSKNTVSFSLLSLKGVGKFAGGVLVLSILTLILTQVDKVLLSKLLSLSEYGYYTLASVSAGSLYMMTGPISQAFSPKLAELHAANDHVKLKEKYHQGAQLFSVVMGSAAMIFFFFGQTILYLWTQNTEMASRSSVIFRILSIGNLLNGLNTMPYLLQIAFGWISIVTRINLLAVLIIVPLLIYITPIYGALGASTVWLIFNAGYLIIGSIFMYRKLLMTERWKWVLNDIFIPVIVATVVAFIFSFIMPSNLSYWLQLVYLFIAGCCVFIATSFSTLYMRNSIYFMIQYIQQRTRNSQVGNSNN